jgi:hypothetical protein
MKLRKLDAILFIIGCGAGYILWFDILPAL